MSAGKVLWLIIPFKVLAPSKHVMTVQQMEQIEIKTKHQELCLQTPSSFHVEFLNWRCVYTNPHGLTFTWRGCCGSCLWHKPTELAHSFLFCSCLYCCLYGPFNCISFNKFSRQLPAFSLRSSGLISALVVLSTIYLFTKVSFSPDVILCGWLGLNHQLNN